jgi:AcrR family transcriptional regulator
MALSMRWRPVRAQRSVGYGVRAGRRTLFARQGVENTRINEITEEADVGFGSFYNHFDSKEAIVEAVVEETVAVDHGKGGGQAERRVA